MKYTENVKSINNAFLWLESVLDAAAAAAIALALLQAVRLWRAIVSKLPWWQALWRFILKCPSAWTIKPKLARRRQNQQLCQEIGLNCNCSGIWNWPQKDNIYLHQTHPCQTPEQQGIDVAGNLLALLKFAINLWWKRMIGFKLTPPPPPLGATVSWLLDIKRGVNGCSSLGGGGLAGRPWNIYFQLASTLNSCDIRKRLQSKVKKSYFVRSIITLCQNDKEFSIFVTYLQMKTNVFFARSLTSTLWNFSWNSQIN